MTGIARLPDAYGAALRAATETALDAGLFYDDAVDAFVLARTAVHDPAQDKFLGVFDEPSGFPERRVFNVAIEAKIATADRGTWVVVQHHLTDRTWFDAVMADGSGSRAIGGSTDHYTEMPTYQDVYRRMAGYEIYQMRHDVEACRHRARNLAIITDRGFRVGQIFHNLPIGSALYSTVTITALHPPPDAHTTIIGPDDRGDGWLTLTMVKRGSRLRYRVNLAAIALAEAADAARPAPAALPLLAMT